MPTVHQVMVFIVMIYTNFYVNAVLYSFPTISFLGLMQLYIFLVWLVLLLTEPGSPTDMEKELINRIYQSISLETEAEGKNKALQAFFNDNRWIYLPSQGLVKGCRFCKICGHYKLPRMHHSGLLNKCVYRMDHHCLVVNNCVGYRNYHMFVQFTVLTLVVWLIDLTTTIIGNTNNFSKSIGRGADWSHTLVVDCNSCSGRSRIIVRVVHWLRNL